MVGAMVGVITGSPEPGVAGVVVLLALRFMHGCGVSPAAPGINDGLAASTAAQAAGGQP